MAQASHWMKFTQRCHTFAQPPKPGRLRSVLETSLRALPISIMRTEKFLGFTQACMHEQAVSTLPMKAANFMSAFFTPRTIMAIVRPSRQLAN